MNSISEAPLLTITGDTIGLGPLEHEFIPLYHRWLNDLRHGRNFGDTPEPWSVERVTALVDMRATSTTETVFFTIYALSDNRPIGYTMLLDIRLRHRSAEFAIHIGEDDVHGLGYGTEVARLMLDYAFSVVGLHSVHLSVAEFNIGGRIAYQRAGFRETGRRRETLRMGNRFWDLIFMDCLAEEYLRRVSVDTGLRSGHSQQGDAMPNVP